MKIALDTNVLAYAEGTNGAAMRDKTLDLIQWFQPGAIVLPVQTLGELFNVLVRKAKRRPADFVAGFQVCNSGLNLSELPLFGLDVGGYIVATLPGFRLSKATARRSSHRSGLARLRP